MPVAPADRQHGISRVPAVGAGAIAADEPAPAVGGHEARVPARFAEPGRLDLSAFAAIVHHGRHMFTSEATTRGVQVSVVSEFSAERSRPTDGQWFFFYTITIENTGSETVQLLSRHWIITDASGRVEEVRGPGVVGKQPVLAPGQSFTYTSGCPLPTAFGTMEGTYQMITEGGERFDARIAPFALSEPYTVH
jgi:ApaG protein